MIFLPTDVTFFLTILIGTAIGAALGYYGQCTSGTCPLTSTWWRGALYGCTLGIFFGTSFAPKNQSSDRNESFNDIQLASPPMITTPERSEDGKSSHPPPPMPDR